MEVASRSVHDEKALFDEDDADDDEIVLGRSDSGQEEKETSKQRLLSLAKVKPEFEGLRITPSGHRIQDIRELMTVPVRRTRPFPFYYYPDFAYPRSLLLLILPRAHPLSKCTVSTLTLTTNDKF